MEAVKGRGRKEKRKGAKEEKSERKKEGLGRRNTTIQM